MVSHCSPFCSRTIVVAIHRFVIALLAVGLSAGSVRAQWNEVVLYRFDQNTSQAEDGYHPTGQLILDAQGALYGVTQQGARTDPAITGFGMVFKLAPPRNGQTQWTRIVLHSFNGAPEDGAAPSGGLVKDAKGALYGITAGGGKFNSGTVFKLTPPRSGQTVWTAEVLHSFKGGGEGSGPRGDLIFDKTGTIYGVTQSGGITGCHDSHPQPIDCGTVFQLTPPSHDETEWTHTVIYTFRGEDDGGRPFAGLISDKRGEIYGTTWDDNSGPKLGTVFKLTPPSAGRTSWSQTVLYRFQGNEDGAHPAGRLLFDRSGALYGTTEGGGAPNPHRLNLANGGGTAFKLSPPLPGQTNWTETVLYRFQDGDDGATSFSSLVSDREGALYGTTAGGGISGQGTVFKLTPPAGGQSQWAEAILYRFKNDPDGAQSYEGLTFGTDGKLYGITMLGGTAKGVGTVFELIPKRLVP